ncbi:phenylacetate--CoA ligase family protein [Streptomyces monticola]|uniref:Phenylacetate--CoA ligase family protein n=1 Tax=Streptomyces monticola TaxID=2666263 RepID=A0ABW2JLS7_9ACTN
MTPEGNDSARSAGWLGRDVRRARKQGETALARRRRDRLAAMVTHARATSPYYRELYAGLPERIEDASLLPVTDKNRLMERFDDWVSDSRAGLDQVRALADDPGRIGERFLGSYMVATTSGTSGRRGLFLLDDGYLNVAAALNTRALTEYLGPTGLARATMRGWRYAQLVATGGHYASFSSYSRLMREGGWRAKVLRAFSVHTPLPQLVDRLNSYRPAVVIGYASTVMLLAAEQEAGRLRIDPVLIQPAGETMTQADTDRIARAFGSTVRTFYGATECVHLSHGCSEGWYHVNSDWAVVEPVDADYRPTPPGEYSHTVLVSNLANRVQPFLRYDLGDSVMLRPDPCPCGSPLPALRVQGRAGDALTFPTAHGAPVRLSPLAVSTLFDRTRGVELFQVEQAGPKALRVRLRVAAEADQDRVWQDVQQELSRLLADNALDDVTVERSDQAPQQSPGGKYRTVIPYAP